MSDKTRTLIRKTYDVERKTIDEDAGIFEAMISTESIDRQADIVVADGGDVANWLRNPVVLFGHNYSDPERLVANGLEIEKIKGKGIRSVFQFVPWGTSIGADVTRRLWTGRFLNATSIGFLPDWKQVVPIDADGNEIPPEEREPTDFYFAGGRKFKKWELLEFSLVPVPANQDALRLAVRGAIERLDVGRIEAKLARRSQTPAVRALESFFSELLDQTAEVDPVVWITRDAVLRPFPNEHACRLRDPGDFEADSFRRTDRETDEGKPFSVIMGKLEGEDSMVDQSFRYPKDVWKEGEANQHCVDHDGILFEPASGEEALRPDVSRSTLSPDPASTGRSAPTIPAESDDDSTELTEERYETIAGEILELLDGFFPPRA